MYPAERTWTYHDRSDAYEIAEMLRGLARIFGVDAFAVVLRQNHSDAYVYLELPIPVEDMDAHWLAWALDIRKWDSYEEGTRGYRQWFKLHEVTPNP